MTQTKRNNRPVFKRSVAMELVKYGATLVEVVPNRNNPGYKVYFFKNDEKFNSLMAILAN
ncbi:hypothetical protein [Kurthia massiliensis]|uniref:hypothetical protein n=1 Tax=Kurthia massiliensis TaxID=1033739 RepID=UPI000474FA9F|nr:hypothetical protein [Kurthia massiliensis]